MSTSPIRPPSTHACVQDEITAHANFATTKTSFMDLRDLAWAVTGETGLEVAFKCDYRVTVRVFGLLPLPIARGFKGGFEMMAASSEPGACTRARASQTTRARVPNQRTSPLRLHNRPRSCAYGQL